MIILFCILIPTIYLLIKIVLFFITRKLGKFSYDGLSVAGFSYNSEKDIFYSTMNAWQKNFGYSHLYDVAAPLFRMIIDTEPIRFSYNDKQWLITFWKGQYGIVTGAEIGIYCTKEKKIRKNTVYLPVSDNERLDMSFILYKNGKKLIKIKARHWWLAAFKLGEFSKLKELDMDINLIFPNREMLEAFVKAFKKLGYHSDDYRIIDRTFIFNYKKPKTRKVWTRFLIPDFIIQSLNKKNVNLYNRLLANSIDDNNYDDSKTTGKVILLSNFIPNFLKGKVDEEKSNEIKEVINDNIIFLNAEVKKGDSNE